MKVSKNNYLLATVLFSILFTWSVASVQAKTSTDDCGFHTCNFDRSGIPPEKNISLKYERVVDGDTFVASGRKIRVWGINAPEKKEAGYKVAGWFLESLLKDSDLSCKFIYKDKYQRDVMQCYSGDVDIGSEMVRFGLAKDYKKYSGGYYTPEEDFAKKSKKGIWSIETGK